MRIVCDSCGAKYSIADEKIFGKVFKVRCKKCSAMINVDGTSMGDSVGEEDEATRVFDTNAPQQGGASASDAKGEWFVVIEDEQAGPFTRDQIVERIEQGMLGPESFAWRDGMSDWQHLSALTDFSSHLGGGGQTSGVAADPVGPSDDSDAFFSDDATRVVDSSSVDVGAAASGRDRVESFPSGGFSAVDSASSSPFASSAGSASAGADDDDIFSQAERPERGQSNPSFVGERSESSVLFSLDSLSGVRGESDKGPKKDVPRTEESGLINLEAVMATRGGAVADGSDGPGDTRTSQAAPALTIASNAATLPKPADRSRIAIVALLVVLLLAIPLTGAAVWLLLSGSDAEDAAVSEDVAAVSPEPEPESEPAGLAVDQQEEPPTDERVAAADTDGDEHDAGDEQIVDVDEDIDETEEDDGAPEGEDASTDDEEEAVAAAQPSAEEEAAAARRAERERQERRERERRERAAREREEQRAAAQQQDSDDDRVADVVSRVRRQQQAEPEPEPESNDGLPERLTPDDVRTTVRRYGSQIRRCKYDDEQAGTYQGRWVIQPSGSVTNAQVNNMNETGECILGVIRSFSFPRFSGDPIPVPRFPFTIN